MMSTIFFILVHVSLLLSIGMIVMVLRKSRRSQIRTAFLVTLGVMTIWNIGTLLEMDLRAATGVEHVFFINLCYIGICLAPIAILYMGKVIMCLDWQPEPRHALFLIIPVVSIVMVFTNSLHHLFFVNLSLSSSEAVYGAYYYFHSFYSYGCMVVGIIFMITASFRNSGIFSKQSLFVTAGIFITAVPNVLYSFGIGNLPFSISTVAFTASVICFSVAFLKYRFTTALPITLQQVVNLISDGYLVVDINSRVLAFNMALFRMFPEPLYINLGSDLRAFFKQRFIGISYDRFVELQARAATQQETVAAECRVLGGAYVSVEVTPVMRNNTHIGSIMLFKDITQSKLFIESTQAASRAKSNFLSHMSHEMRTPLNAIIGMINIGIAAADIEKKDYCLNRAKSASMHLLNLINDVLDMSKIEADKFEVSHSQFDFEKMLMNTINVANVRAEEKKLNFAVNINKNVPARIESDELRLSQVITNLLSNAVKFTPEKGTIMLSAEKIEEIGDEVKLRFEVADTGIGISKEQQELLFKSFSQADSNITQKFGGTGLGLAISKRIVELLDGEIWIESELGKGAKFIFTIRAKQLAESKDDTQALSREADTVDKIHHDFSGHTLLVVEDIDINREIISAMLKETGVAVDFAENGKIAISMYEKNPDKYSLIFMDIQMPEIDGYEATRAIRAMNFARAKEIPIIAMTANVFREDIKKCMDAGMTEHLGKPLNIADVLNSLQKYLGNLRFDNATLT